MSKENLEAFAEAVSKSEELQKRLASLQLEISRSAAEKMAKLSESAGTPFTAEEYLKAVAESSEEMSAEQLQSVAGGASESPVKQTVCTSLFYSNSWEPGCNQTRVTALPGDECLPKPAP
jgi:predicted ribosomally synthesized peptide with nif11-like leader